MDKDEIKQILLDTLTPFQKQSFEHHDIPFGRRTGRTYLLSIMCLLWMLDNINKEITVVDHYRDTSSGNIAMKNQVVRLFEQYVERHHYRLVVEKYQRTYKVKLTYDEILQWIK